MQSIAFKVLSIRVLAGVGMVLPNLGKPARKEPPRILKIAKRLGKWVLGSFAALFLFGLVLQISGYKPPKPPPEPEATAAPSTPAVPPEQSASLPADPPAAPNEKVVANDRAFACRAKSDVEQLLKYVADGDEQAFSRLVTFGQATGQCQVLKSGDSYFIEDSTASGLVQIRRKGENDTYWTIATSLN